jgi:hypothetical protein
LMFGKKRSDWLVWPARPVLDGDLVEIPAVH